MPRCGTGDGATMRPREVKRELIRALAPAAGGLFTGDPGAGELLRVMGAEKPEERVAQNERLPAAGCTRKAAKGEPEQEDPVTESAFIWIVPAWAPGAGLLWRFSFESPVLPWPISVP